MNSHTPQPIVKQSSPLKSYLSLVWKILLPIAIGLTVVGWLFHNEFSPEVWISITWDSHLVWCIILAWALMLGRDFGLSWRFRAITDRRLRWSQAIKVNLLCEFTSCVTPSAVGGSAMGLVFMNREGIELGRATTLMMTTLFLDELFFVISLPIIMLIAPYGDLFGFGSSAFSTGLQTTFWIVYGILVAYTALLFTGILLKPRAIHRLINKIFSLRWLARWRTKADQMGANIVSTGVELRTRPLRWWAETFCATALSWSSRYLVVNALFLGLVPTADQLIVFIRQFVVWVVLMASPTPGGSGVSEWLFATYYGDLIPTAGLALIIALFWRVISYYIYLIIGACIVPSWIRKSFKKQSSTR